MSLSAVDAEQVIAADASSWVLAIFRIKMSGK
jgi:hypothetical protein